MAVAPRDVTPIIACIRNFLSGRKLVNRLRFEGLISPRSGPAPKLPGGPSHKLSVNYYYERDGRRLCEPPKLAYDQKAITAGETSSAPASVPPANKVPKAGFGFDWQTGGRLY